MNGYRDWKPEVAVLADAAIDGEHVTIRNVPNFDYRTEIDFTPHYDTRAYDLGRLRGLDLFVTYWGSPLIAHPILSFDFGDQGHICFSIETRPERGEAYSTILGLVSGPNPSMIRVFGRHCRAARVAKLADAPDLGLRNRRFQSSAFRFKVNRFLRGKNGDFCEIDLSVDDGQELRSF